MNVVAGVGENGVVVRVLPLVQRLPRMTTDEQGELVAGW